MSEQVLEPSIVSERLDGHLDPVEIAAFIDRVIDGDARRRVEAHLASCADCRAELMDATRVVATLPSRRARAMWIPGAAAAAAAAIVILAVWPRDVRDSEVHREAPVTTTVAPRGLSPVGAVDSAPTLRWSSVPHTDRYQVRVFGTDGAVLWERETTDTSVAMPDSIGVRSSHTYHWKVEAYTGFDRRAASELIEFSVRFPRR
jgi:hypothetical protein